MASGINNLISAVTRSISVPVGPASRHSAPAREPDHRSEGGTDAAGQSNPQGDPGTAKWEEVMQAGRKTLAALSEYAQRAGLTNETTIYYQRDDQNGRMYLHVMDKHTGKELYRIPKDLLSSPTLKAEESHQLNVQV
jgi:uncharacterized FlaG/YvyC family protein